MPEGSASPILELLHQMHAELGDVRSDISNVRLEMAPRRTWLRCGPMSANIHILRADVASDVLTTRTELSEQIVGLRRAAVDYRPSVIGHGSEFEARVRRVQQQHLDLPSLHPT